MPWRESSPVNERLRFIVCYLGGAYSMTGLCDRFGISRECGYRWLRRYHEEGPPGLMDRPPIPRTSPHKLSSERAALLLDAKRRHPFWGPRKIVAYLASRDPELVLPAPSTVGALFAREGLVQPRRVRRRSVHPGARRLDPEAPNQVWCADFKGEFHTQDRRYCYPLTVTDGFSRFLLGCTGLGSTSCREARPVFKRLFELYGLPDVIRTDNGAPFVAPALAGLSRLGVWWIKLGIRRERITPGRPAENGRHERMHRTLKAETTRPPSENLLAQQARFDAFRREFNEERPHEALGQQPPITRYVGSGRPLPPRVPAPEYAGHCEIRRVDDRGRIKFKRQHYFLSSTLIGERVALEEVDDGIWSIQFYQESLIRLNEATSSLT